MKRSEFLKRMLAGLGILSASESVVEALPVSKPVSRPSALGKADCVLTMTENGWVVTEISPEAWIKKTYPPPHKITKITQ